MPIPPAEQMGYASPATVRQVIARFRDSGFSTAFTTDSIQRIGVTESLAPRTIQTLKLLGLIDDEGVATEHFDRLRRAPSSEFKPELVSLLRQAYAPVFDILDPAVASYEDVQDAFRTFKPEGQRDRMVALFLGLLEYAEYSDTLPSGRAATSRSTTSGRIASSRPKPARPKKEQKVAERTKAVKADSKAAIRPPDVRGHAERGERVEVKLGSDGMVVAYVDVRWLSLPHDKFSALRKAIEDLKALAYEDSAPPSAAAVTDEESEEAVS